MTFIAATGSNSDVANSYVDVAYADDYHGLRGNRNWVDATTQAKQAALVRATDFIEQNYYTSWIGGVAVAVPGLSWPRSYLTPVWSNTAIPDNLKKAVCELAFEALSGPLMENTNPATPVLKRKKVDVLEKEWFAPTGKTMIKRPIVNGYLSVLLCNSSSGYNVKTVRVY